MGGVQSSGLPSKDEILKKTRGGRDIVNQVFDFMISKTTLRELYSLANPEQCKKYIFLTADALDIMFKRIELEPKEGPRGVIYFQKVEELTKSPTSDDVRGKQRAVICLKLAFLYVRIFQIFASLALSVLDVNPESETKFIDGMSRYGALDENLPLFGQRKPFSRGGAGLPSTKPLPSSFDSFRSVLSEVVGESRYYKFSGVPIYLDWNSMNSSGTLRIIYEYKKERKNRPGYFDDKRLTARVAIRIISPDEEIQISLTEIRDAEGRAADDISMKFYRKMIGDVYRHNNKSIPEELNRVFSKIVKGEKVDEDRDYNRNRGYDKDSAAVSEGLHTKLLLDAFRQTVPVKAHCVARALQLLSDTGLQAVFPKEVYSSVCKVKFLSDNRSLPATGDRVTKSYGIYALAQLFYDTLRGSTPAISEATREQYNSFLQKLAFVFEETKRQPVSIDDVRSKAPSGICGTENQDHLLKVSNRDVIRQMRVQAKQMIDYQINHTAGVTNILKKLFLLPIESGKPLQIHPNVKKYGMEEVNKIAGEARELLIEYYTNCEIMYRKGAEILAANRGMVTKI